MIFSKAMSMSGQVTCMCCNIHRVAGRFYADPGGPTLQILPRVPTNELGTAANQQQIKR